MCFLKVYLNLAVSLAPVKLADIRKKFIASSAVVPASIEVVVNAIATNLMNEIK